MREIKFRLWDGESKKMYTPKEMTSTIWYNVGGAVWHNETDENSNWIVMQYTGLKDKNGTEIYEGDIVKCSIGGTPQENFIEITELRDFYEMLDASDGYMRINEESLEVIGNIYENKELLNADQS